MQTEISFETADAETGRALLAVLSHPGFFRVERHHRGHWAAECPDGHISDDGLPCWRYDVGVSISVGRVSWWHGATWQEAICAAAKAIAG